MIRALDTVIIFSWALSRDCADDRSGMEFTRKLLHSPSSNTPRKTLTTKNIYLLHSNPGDYLRTQLRGEQMIAM